MSKVKNIIKSAVIGYFSLIAETYDERYYKYSCRMI